MVQGTDLSQGVMDLRQVVLGLIVLSTIGLISLTSVFFWLLYKLVT